MNDKSHILDAIASISSLFEKKKVILEFLSKACKEYFNIGGKNSSFISLLNLHLNKVIYGNQQAKNDPH